MVTAVVAEHRKDDNLLERHQKGRGAGAWSDARTSWSLCCLAVR